MLRRFSRQPAFLSSRYYSSSQKVLVEIKTVGIVGLGLMGHGVAQVTAQAGYNVVAVESSTDALQVGMYIYEERRSCNLLYRVFHYIQE